MAVNMQTNFLLGKQFLSLKQVKDDIILKQSVSCNLVLAIVNGLPRSGKSSTVHGILQKALIAKTEDGTSLDVCEKNGLSCFKVAIVGRKPYKELIWMSQTPVSTHTFFIASSILHDSLLRGQEVELTSKTVNGKALKVFKNKSLNKHLHQVYTDIDRALRRADLNPELKRILPSGITLVNVFDVGMNKGVHDFLCLIACYGCRMFSVVVLNLENDLPNLKHPPNLDHDCYKNTPSANMMQDESRLFYLLRFAAVTQLATGNVDSVVFVATHDGKKTPSELHNAKEKLKHELEQEAQRQKLSNSLVSKVQLLNPNDSDEIQQFRKALENTVISRGAMLDMKLSWIFLRTLLYNEEKLYIATYEIENLANELNIIGEDFKEFLGTFTDFGSILYAPDIPTLNKFVILQPTQFVNCIGKLFNPPQCANHDSSFDGLFSQEEVANIVGHDQGATEIISNTLCDIGLAVLVDAARVFHVQANNSQSGGSASGSLPILEGQDPSSSGNFSTVHVAPCLYVPRARVKQLVLPPKVDSLLLMYKSQLIPPHMPAIFVKYFLKMSDALLISEAHSNVVQFQFPSKGAVLLIFYNKFVEIQVEHLSEDRYEKVVSCCEEAMQAIAKFIKKMGYQFSLCCIAHMPHNGSGDSIDQLESGHYEDLPNNCLCDACESYEKTSPVRALWKKTINKVCINN